LWPVDYVRRRRSDAKANDRIGEALRRQEEREVGAVKSKVGAVEKTDS